MKKTLSEMLRSVTWGGDGYNPYAAEAKSGPSQAEQYASGRSRTMDDYVNQQQGNIDTDLKEFEGDDVTKTPMYHRLLTTGTEDTTAMYNQARTKRAAQAKTAGFGYTSPVAQSDQATVGAMEASDLGKLPREVADQVTGYKMNAAKTRAGLVGDYVGGGTASMGQWGNLETQRKQRQMEMYSRLAGLGVAAATPFMPHG